jgi:hypothetical protein
MLVQVVAACYVLLGTAALGWIVVRAVYRAALTRRAPTAESWPAPSRPAAVATLVHGTWARGAGWTRAESPLGTALRAAFHDRVAVFRFEWTGHNRARARARAAERLQEHLRALLVRYPDARHHVIAHSHAGNVVLYALRDEALSARLHGVVCLSTPFLHVRPRQLGAITNAAVVAALVVGPWMVIGSGLQWLGAGEDAAILGALIAAAAIAYGLVRRSRYETDLLLRTAALPDAVAAPCLILRASGDEAGAALGLVRFLSWLAGLCWIAPAGVAAEVVSVIGAWSEMARRFWGPAAVCALFGGVALILDWQFGPFLADAVPVRVAAQVATAAALLAGLATLAIWWLGAGAGVYGYVLGFAAAGLVLSPLVLLLALLTAPFGPDLVLSCVQLDITAEATPPGTWTVHHVGGVPRSGERRGSGLAGAHGLMHGTHASPDAIRAVVEWLLRTAG